LPDARGFAPFKKSDRAFFLLLLALIWVGNLMGFVPDMIRHFPARRRIRRSRLITASCFLRDFITRKRLHPAFAIGAIWMLGLQIIATYFYVSPLMASVATRLIRTIG
jgi:hypothetical protein